MTFNRITKVLENPFNNEDGTYKTKITWSKSAIHTHLRKSGIDVILSRKWQIEP